MNCRFSRSASCAPSKCAALPLWAAMSKNAASAISPASPTTRAATGIVRNARTPSGPTGWKAARPNCCRSSTSTWSSQFPKKWLASPSTTRKWSTASCSKPLPRRCSPSHAIPNTSARRSASSLSFTPGGRTCFIIPTSTA